MKNYLATKWQTLRAWSSTTWAQGRIGKAKVVLAWYGLAVVMMAPIGLLIPLEETTAKSDLLLCHTKEDVLAIANARDPLNERLHKALQGDSQRMLEMMQTPMYKSRFLNAVIGKQTALIREGKCLIGNTGERIAFHGVLQQARKDISMSETIEVQYRDKWYWTSTADLNLALVGQDNGSTVQAAQSKGHQRPVPPFARNESYAQVRVVLMRDGWQPVISKDADQCMEGDTRCEGRPEMQTCSGSGLAMCRFRWRRDGQQLTICTAGEEQAMFHSICE